jgi:N-(2-amino-2-carboxyethyl)-L-glutamate synthase
LQATLAPQASSRGERLISAPEEFNAGDLYIGIGYIDMGGLFHRFPILKCEGFNFAGSVKLKTALGLLERVEQEEGNS